MTLVASLATVQTAASDARPWPPGARGRRHRSRVQYTLDHGRHRPIASPQHIKSSARARRYGCRRRTTNIFGQSLPVTQSSPLDGS